MTWSSGGNSAFGGALGSTGVYAVRVKRVSGAGLSAQRSPAPNQRRVGRLDGQTTQAAEPISLVRFIARGDPPRRVDVVRYPLSLRNVEDLLFERGIDICHETVRLWWNRFGPMFAGEIRRRRVQRMRQFTHWRWHLDEMYVRINGEMLYLWRAVDHEGEGLESFVTKERNKAAALKFV
jgi:DDE domain